MGSRWGLRLFDLFHDNIHGWCPRARQLLGIRGSTGERNGRSRVSAMLKPIGPDSMEETELE